MFRLWYAKAQVQLHAPLVILINESRGELTKPETQLYILLIDKANESSVSITGSARGQINLQKYYVDIISLFSSVGHWTTAETFFSGIIIMIIIMQSIYVPQLGSRWGDMLIALETQDLCLLSVFSFSDELLKIEASPVFDVI